MSESRGWCAGAFSLEGPRRRLAGLPGDERGVVFYYTAIIMFFILTLLTIIYDVSQVSEQKMRAQAAADAAALEMAVWQARGMNMVQNINDEIYDLDVVFAALYGVAGGMTIIGEAFIALAEIPYIGEIFEAIGEAIEAAAAIIADIAYYGHKLMVTYFLDPLRKVYMYGSMALGYLSANNVAYENGADRIIPSISYGGSSGGIFGKIFSFIVKQVNRLTGQFVALGIPTSPYAALYLPLEAKKPDRLPLNTKDPEGAAGAAFLVLLDALCTNEDFEEMCADFQETWKDAPLVSRDPDQLKIPPMIWIVHKSNDLTFFSKYFLGGGDSKDREFPVIAYAVGQAMGGNVTERSSEDNPYRPIGKGVAADAFLVPMNTLEFSRSVSALGVTLEFSFQDYVDKLFAH